MFLLQEFYAQSGTTYFAYSLLLQLFQSNTFETIYISFESYRLRILLATYKRILGLPPVMATGRPGPDPDRF